MDSKHIPTVTHGPAGTPPPTQAAARPFAGVQNPGPTTVLVKPAASVPTIPVVPRFALLDAAISELNSIINRLQNTPDYVSPSDAKLIDEAEASIRNIVAEFAKVRSL